MERKIIKRMSPNHFNGRGGETPIMIVNHITEGAVKGAVSWLCNKDSAASAHYVVARNGDIYQLVDIRNGAWCNGTAIYNKGKYYYKNSTNSIVKGKAVNANLYTVSIEHEGYFNKGKGALTEEQYQATLWLHRHIINEVKSKYGHDIVVDREHIVGHYEVAPKEKPNCPGALFPWDRLIKDLQNKGGGAMDKANRVKFDFNNKKFTVDGKLIDGHNYVQARELLEKLGYTVGWDNALREIKVK